MTLYSVSTLSVDAFDAWIAAAGGAPLSKCERSPTPPPRPFNALARARSRSRSPRASGSRSRSPSPSLEPTTPTDRSDAIDYGFEVEDEPAQVFNYDLSSSPKTKAAELAHMRASVCHDQACQDLTLARCPSKPRTPRKPPTYLCCDEPGPPTPHSPTEAQRYAAAHRASLDTDPVPTHSRRSFADDDDDEKCDDEGIIWFGRREAPCAEKVAMFYGSVGRALCPERSAGQRTAGGCPGGKKSPQPQLMQRLVRGWKERRRRRSSKD